MFTRKAPASPAELLEQTREAQRDHAEAVAKANARLIQAHTAIVADVRDRKATIKEQIQLLDAEHAGLVKVEAAANHAEPVH